MTIFSELYSFTALNEDETAVSTSLISKSRSSLKRSAYRSKVMAADEWPSIRCMAFTFAPECTAMDAAVSPVLSLEQQFPGVPPLADRTQRRSDGTEQRNVPGFAALGSAQDETAAHLGYALAHMQPMPEEIDVTDRERRGFAPTKPA